MARGGNHAEAGKEITFVNLAVDRYRRQTQPSCVKTEQWIRHRIRRTRAGEDLRLELRGCDFRLGRPPLHSRQPSDVIGVAMGDVDPPQLARVCPEGGQRLLDGQAASGHPSIHQRRRPPTEPRWSSNAWSRRRGTPRTRSASEPRPCFSLLSSSSLLTNMPRSEGRCTLPSPLCTLCPSPETRQLPTSAGP